jgi:hypothetical protein
MRGVLWSTVVCFVACSSDDDEGDDHGHDLPAVCQDIVDVCHEADENGVEGAAECHETGHGGDEAACEADHDSCIALCTAEV